MYGVLSSIPFFLGALFFLAGYFLLGTVASSSEMIQKGDIDGAEKNLKLTKKPEWLFSTNRAYYHLLECTIHSHRKNNQATEASFQKALEIGLPSGNEEAMIRLNLANLAATRNNCNGANEQIKKIKQLNVNDPQMLEQVKLFERAYKQRGQMKFQQQQQHQRRGRRR